MVETIVTRTAPAIEDFGGFLKVLRVDLEASDRTLLLLYARGAKGATFGELESWMHPKMRKNLRRTLHGLEHDKAFVHADGEGFRITYRGQKFVEAKRLMEPEV
jgi:hypothetical protein